MARRAVAIYREKKGFVDQVYTQKVKRAIIKHLVFTGKNIVVKDTNKLYGYVEYI